MSQYVDEVCWRALSSSEQNVPIVNDLTCSQCDQMMMLFLQYLPDRVFNLPKLVRNCAKILNDPLKMANVF